jgi:hypothetical protein
MQTTVPFLLHICTAESKAEAWGAKQRTPWQPPSEIACTYVEIGKSSVNYGG